MPGKSSILDSNSCSSNSACSSSKKSIMDYGELLCRAQVNDKHKAKQDVRCYKTGFSPPKKLDRGTVSSENVKRFLARKELEEKKKLYEAKLKKEKLLALRSQDKKAQKRVQVMLKRTKSANKSVMADAIDNINTADTLEGPMQCDEDDYGYVSQEASAFYQKLMNKYSNMPPEQSGFSKEKKEVKDLNAAKDRVKAALQKEADEAELPHRRKRKEKGDEESIKPSNAEDDCSKSSKTPNNDQSHDEKKESKKEISKKKVRNDAPPPPSFEQLLKLAEQKQREPIDIESLLLPVKKKEPERPMTQQQKLEHMRQLERQRDRMRREKGLPPLSKTTNAPDSGSSNGAKAKITKSCEKNEANTGMSRIPKIGSNSNSKSNELPKTKSEKVNGQDKQNNTKIVKKVSFQPQKQNQNSKLSEKPKDVIEKKNDEIAKISASISDIDKEIELLKKKRMLLRASSAVPVKNEVPTYKPTVLKTLQDSSASKNVSRDRPVQGVKSGGVTAQKGAGTTSSRPNPPKRPEHLMKKKPMPSKRRIIDSESEYDSDLDDFIEDEDEDEGDYYSKCIGEIFGYDKNRYKDIDDDDECMESNFAQQMKEEYVSTRIGIMEDLEDIRKEQEEKKRRFTKNIKKKN